MDTKDSTTKPFSPRDAAAAAAVARAGSKLDSGAAIPAKTMVEHKAKDNVVSSTKGSS